MVSQPHQEDVVSNASARRLSRGDRQRNERLTRLRAVITRESAVLAFDLAADKQVCALCDQDSQVIARRTITAAGRASTFNSMYNSMRRVSTAEAAQVIPRRIDVVTAGRNDTIQSLASRMAYGNAQVERFMVLNGLASNAQVVPGEKYKIVVRTS